MPRRTPVRMLAFTLAAGLAVLPSCGGEGDTEGTGADSATTTPTTTADAPPTTAGPQVVAVEVRDGSVVGGARRVAVERGGALDIQVSSDVDDEIHVHGYDLTEPVAAGTAATVSFTADIPGVFEVELEDRHLLLVTLEVRG